MFRRAALGSLAARTGSPLLGVKKAGKESVPKPTTGTPCVSRTSAAVAARMWNVDVRKAY